MLPEAAHAHRLRRYWVFPAVVAAVGLVLFALVETVGPPVLRDPSPWLQHPGPLAALIAVALLMVDVALPVPSSLVMVANGALFGLVVGALLSSIGSLGAFVIGFVLGRRGGPLLNRFVPARELARADQVLSRWGLLAIVVSRPVPLLAETVAVVAGTSTLRARSAAAAALAGSLPVAVLYAAAGAVTRRFQHTALTFVAVVLVAGVLWVVGHRHGRPPKPEPRGL